MSINSDKGRNEADTIQVLYAALVATTPNTFPEPRMSLDAPTEKGVYVIESISGATLHVGSTPRAKKGIHQRLKDHLSGKSSFVRSYFNGDSATLRKSCQYRCLIVVDARQRALLEAYAIGRLCPAHIGIG